MTQLERVREDPYVQLDNSAIHDLFGAANQIRIILDLIRDKHLGELSGESRTLFDFVMDASERLQSMMSGLREYKRTLGASQAPQRFDANTVFEEAMLVLRHTAAENDAIVTHDPLPEVWADARQIGSVFACLVGNSIRFRRESRPEIHIAATSNGAEWVFSVSDNGIGIEAGQIERIFGLFYRVQREYPGTGVGLAVARAIIEGHGGRIWAESEPGRGSTFYFSLPNAPTISANSAQTQIK